MPNDKMTVDLYRNGKLLGNLDKKTYLDDTVEPNKEYQYELRGEKEYSKEDQVLIEQKLKNNKIKVNKEKKKNFITDTFSLIKIVKTQKEKGFITIFMEMGGDLVYGNRRNDVLVVIVWKIDSGQGLWLPLNLRKIK